jgi:hypothetical protein
MARAIFGPGSRTSNTNSNAGMAGTPGGRKSAAGAGPGSMLAVGDEGYLWLLVIIEAVVMGILRKRFKRYHGG